VGRPAHELPHPSERRSDSEDASRFTSSGGPAADVPQAQRLARGSSRSSTSEHSAARHRAWRVTGVAICAARAATKRKLRPSTTRSSSSGLVHAQREGSKACEPRAREGPPPSSCWRSRPDRIARGMEARMGETHSGSTHSATARPAKRGALFVRLPHWRARLAEYRLDDVGNKLTDSRRINLPLCRTGLQRHSRPRCCPVREQSPTEGKARPRLWSALLYLCEV
jgi:hypothetical protein